MPIYEVTDESTGRTLELEGDKPPTKAQLDRIFARVNSPGMQVGDDFQAVREATGGSAFNALLMNMARTANDSLRGIKQEIAKGTFGDVLKFTDPAEAEAFLREEAVNEDLANEVSSQFPVAGPVGSGLGYVADPVNLFGGGAVAKGAFKGAQAVGAGSRLAKTIAGGAAGAFGGGTTYIDPDIGMTRGELTALGAGAGLILTPVVDAGVSLYKKRLANNPITLSNMADEYADTYNLELIRNRGNKQKATTEAIKRLGYNKTEAVNMAEKAGRVAPEFGKNPAQALEILKGRAPIRNITDENTLGRLVRNELSTDERIGWANDMLMGGIGTPRKLTPAQAVKVDKIKRDSAFDRALGIVSTRLKKKSPKIHSAFQNFEYTLSKMSSDIIDSGEPFFKSLDKLKGRVDADTYTRLIADLDTNTDTFLKNVQQVPGGKAVAENFKAIRNNLDFLHAANGNVEGVLGKREGFFPRRLSPDPKKAGIIMNNPEYQRVAKELGVKTGDDQRAWNRAIEEYATRKGDPTFAAGASNLSKRRILPFVKPEEVEAYISPRAAYDSYVRDAVHLSARRQLFDDIGAPEFKVSASGEMLPLPRLTEILDQAGLGPGEALDVAQMIQARLGPGEIAMGKMGSMVKDVTHATLLGDLGSTLTQVADLSFGMHKNGVLNTLSGALRAATGRGLDKQQMLGLRDHVIDFASTAPTKKLADQILTISGFRAIDKFGKNTFMNGSVLKNKKLAADPEDFFKKWAPFFGADDTEALRLDLLNYKKPSDATERMGLMLWDELSQVQPISPLEMPQKWLENPNMRLLYTLNSFTLKQMDLLRRDIFQEAAKGNLVKAAKNLVSYATFFTGTTMGVDAMKDHLAGKDRDWEELLTEASLKAVGLNKYTTDKLFTGQEDLTGFLAGMVGAAGATPNMMFNIARDIYKGENPMDAWEFFPVFGRMIKQRSQGDGGEFDQNFDDEFEEDEFELEEF